MKKENISLNSNFNQLTHLEFYKTCLLDSHKHIYCQVLILLCQNCFQLTHLTFDDQLNVILNYIIDNNPSFIFKNIQ